MSTSENRAEGAGLRRAMVAYSGIAVFCVVFSLVYNRFSHGVHSPYMTWLFGWPLVLGALPSMFLYLSGKVRTPGRISFNLWNSAVAALTVSSLLRGIFEIAGTSSDYQVWLMIAGWLMLAAGAAAYLFKK